MLYYKKDVQEVLHHQIEVQELYQQIKGRMCCTIRQRCRSCTTVPDRGAGGAIPSDRRCRRCKHHQIEMQEVLYRKTVVQEVLYHQEQLKEVLYPQIEGQEVRYHQTEKQRCCTAEGAACTIRQRCT